MAGTKKSKVEHMPVRSMPKANERPRNRASPSAAIRLYKHLNDNQKAAIVGMDLGSMLDIKCHTLHNPVINWLSQLYDKNNREFVIPGRGRIPLNDESVYRTLGLPRGEQLVRYGFDSDIEGRLGPVLFPGRSTTPKTSEVFTMLKEMTDFKDSFKQL